MPHAFGDGAAQLPKICEAVEVVDVRARVLEREMFRLAVNIHQPLADLLQHSRRDGARVDARGRAAAAYDLAADDQRAILAHDAVLVQQGAQRIGHIVQREDCLDARGVGVGAHHLFAGPLAQRKRQRVEDNRFAGAGLTGEDVEARRELHAQAVDDRKVGNGEFGKHSKDYAR